jgi:hypothetical protein
MLAEVGKYYKVGAVGPKNAIFASNGGSGGTASHLSSEKIPG